MPPQRSAWGMLGVMSALFGGLVIGHRNARVSKTLGDETQKSTCRLDDDPGFTSHVSDTTLTVEELTCEEQEQTDETEYESGYYSYSEPPMSSTCEETTALPLTSGMTLRSPNATYRLGKTLGSGKFKVVYKAKKMETGEIVALSVLKRAHMAAEELLKEIAFLTELKFSSRLVDMSEAFVHQQSAATGDGVCVCACEWVSGGSIQSQLEEFGPLPPAMVLQLTQQILQGLEYLWQRDVIHGDMKCDNVLLSRAGVPKISDFGLARLLHRTDHTTSRAAAVRTNVVYVPFLDPEAFCHDTGGYLVSHLTDVYAVGLMAVEMATGQKVVAYPPKGMTWTQFKRQQRRHLVDASREACPVQTLPPLVQQFLSACNEHRGAEDVESIGALVQMCAQPQRWRPTASQVLEQFSFGADKLGSGSGIMSAQRPMAVVVDSVEPSLLRVPVCSAEVADVANPLDSKFFQPSGDGCVAKQNRVVYHEAVDSNSGDFCEFHAHVRFNRGDHCTFNATCEMNRGDECVLKPQGRITVNRGDKCRLMGSVLINYGNDCTFLSSTPLLANRGTNCMARVLPLNTSIL